MVFFNYALRKLNAKIVYYGPGLCGKTTNLQWIHDHFEGGQRGKMISLATEGDRTIFFDLLPIDIGTIRGMDVTLQLYTVPGQVHYNSTRQLVLRGADGVVFVADSQRTMRTSNVESFENLQENLMLQGIDLNGFPHVLQFNKRDLRDLLSTEDLNEKLNVFSVPIFEAIATEGIGVQETLEGIVKLVMRNLREKYEPVATASGPQAPGPMPIGGPSGFRTPAPKPPGEIPTTVAPPGSAMPAGEETQRVGFDSDFTAFQDEDEIKTNVYEADRHDPLADTAGPKTPVFEAEVVAAADAAEARESGAQDADVEQPDDEFEGLFTDPRDEDGTDPEIRLPPSAVRTAPEPTVDRSTDPEIITDDLERETEDEGIDDLFRHEAPVDEPTPAAGVVVDGSADEDFAFGARFAEPAPESDEPEAAEGVAFGADVPDDGEAAAEPPEGAPIADDDFAFSSFADEAEPTDEPVIAPSSSTDRYEDRIEAPGPFAPPHGEKVAAAADVALDDEEKVHAEVRQALGAAEDLDALKSLYSSEPTDSDGSADAQWAGTAPDETEPEPTVEEAPSAPSGPPLDEAPEPPPAELSAEPEVRFDLPTGSGPGFSDRPSEPPDEEPRISAEAAPEPEPSPSEDAPDFADQPTEGHPIQVEAVVEAEAVPAEEPEVQPPPPPAARRDPRAKSQPVVFGSGDPFADDVLEPTVEPPAASVVPVSTGVNVTAEDNQLHLQLKGSGAIAEMGQVRALDIEVPVPGQWVGNRKVTLQLRLTLTPAEEDDD